MRPGVAAGPSGHCCCGSGDPRGRRHRGRRGRRDDARIVRRRNGHERPARRLPRHRLRRVARHGSRRLCRVALRHRGSRRAADPVRRRARRVRDRAGVLRGTRASRCARRALGAARPSPVGAPVRARARARAIRCGASGDARALARDAGRALLARTRRRALHEGRQDARRRRRPPSAGTRADARSTGGGGRRRACTAARSPRRSSASTGSCSTRRDLADYRPLWRDPVLVPYAGRRVATRGGLSGVPDLLRGCPESRLSRRRSACSRS